jgi:hypothetical protein
MALIQCSECGQTISDKAENCPKCGATIEGTANHGVSAAARSKSNLENNKFFAFIKPALSYIDNGSLYKKPFSWLYYALAVANLLLPLVILAVAIDNNIFSSGSKVIFTFILIWLIATFASWVGFQIWWNRSAKVIETSSAGSEFTATPVLSHFIQTIGEWLGSWIAIVGFGSSLFTWIFLGYGGYGGYGLWFFSLGAKGIILCPIGGFLTIVVFRCIAEGCRALASIADNTKKK